MPPTSERLDLHVNPAVRAAFVRQAAGRGLSLNEYANEVFCQLWGWEPANFPIPRKTPGRKARADGQPFPRRPRKPRP